MSNPDISVIVPVYNKINYLRTCLESIVNQQGVVIEIICVDDGSFDGSYEFISELAKTDNRLSIVKNEQNKGAAYSRNRAIFLARGRYIQFTDADDILPENALKILYDAAERTKSELIRGQLLGLTDENLYLWPTNEILEEKTGEFIDIPEMWCPWFHFTYLLSRELILREKIYYPNLQAGEDPVFMAKALTRANRVSIIPTPVYIYRENQSRPRPSLGLLQDYIKHAELIKDIYSGDYLECWRSYCNFIINDIRLLLAQAEIFEYDLSILEKRLELLSDDLTC